MQEYHHRRVAEFEAAENFASPAAAKAALEEVEAERVRVCEGHYHGNPGCPCLLFSEVGSALRYAALGNNNPWEMVRAKRREHKMLMRIRQGRNLSARMHRSLHPEIAAKTAGKCLGEAYKHYLG